MSSILLCCVAVLSQLLLADCFENQTNDLNLRPFEGSSAGDLLKIEHEGQNGTRTRRQANTNINTNLGVNFDVNKMVDKIEGWIKESKPGEKSGFVKGLMEMMSFEAPPGYSVMVYNLNQEYRNGLRGVIMHKQRTEYNSHWGLWVFKCGTFMNQGNRGYDNWAYAAAIPTQFQHGNGVIFRHPDCDHPAYRPFNHYVLHGKDYDQPTIRQFFGVDSIEECASWTTEIDENVAVYEHGTKICHVKPINYGGGISYERKGNKIGTYDIKYNDIEETRDDNVRARWIQEGKCDAMHTLKDGRHFCKVFPSRAGFTLLVRHRD